MITRIEVDGYKSFSRLELDLFPLTIIAGRNGVGKSNLFDAMRHISSLVGLTLREAFEMDRGSFIELFTLYPDGSRAETISYAIEMLLPRSITDSFGDSVNLKYLRMRYEISIGLSIEENRLLLQKERLYVVKRKDDNFLKKYGKNNLKLPELHGGKNYFIETEGNTITLSQDGRAGGKRSHNALMAQRSVISTVTTSEFPHALACKSMLENILFLQLNPDKLREPSKVMSSPYMQSDGTNLSAHINRLKGQSEGVIRRMSRTLSTIVPSINSVDVDVDEKREEYVLYVTHKDSYKVNSRLLSDGTLRIIALLAVRYDAEFQGTVIFEEPENGIHPGRIPRVIDLLRSMTDINKNVGARQVIANTHSTKVLRSAEHTEIAIASLSRVKSDKHGFYTATDIKAVKNPLLSTGDDVAKLQLDEMLETDEDVTIAGLDSNDAAD